MAIVLILQGVSGSGKSTYLKKLTQSLKSKNVDVFTCSSDKFFTDAEGNYNFDPTRLAEAHGTCLKEFIKHCDNINYAERTGLVDYYSSYIIVDNTNLTVEEFMPYHAIGRAYQHAVELITIKADINLCIKRNVHNVPEYIIGMQQQKLNSCHVPSFIVRKFYMEGDLI